MDLALLSTKTETVESTRSLIAAVRRSAYLKVSALIVSTVVRYQVLISADGCQKGCQWIGLRDENHPATGRRSPGPDSRHLVPNAFADTVVVGR